MVLSNSHCCPNGKVIYWFTLLHPSELCYFCKTQISQQARAWKQISEHNIVLWLKISAVSNLFSYLKGVEFPTN